MFIVSSFYQVCWCILHRVCLICLTFCSAWYKDEIENNACFIYAIGVNFAKGIFMHTKTCHNTF